MMADARRDRVKQRHADVVGDAHAHEWPRQLEAASKAAPRTFMRDQAIHLLTAESNAAILVVQRAADAVDPCAFAEAVAADQTDPFAFGDIDIDRIERDEAA